LSYWDTSALLKLYAEEEDSPEFWKLLLRSSSGIKTSVIAQAEIFCALQKKARVGSLKQGGFDAIYTRFTRDVQEGRIVLLAITPSVFREMERSGSALARKRLPLLRALDLIHLATAEAFKSPELVATDERLRAGAIALGLKVIPERRSSS